jgi:anti-sigma B factor antagonist
MTSRVKVRFESDKAILVVTGNLVRGDHLTQLREMVDTLLSDGHLNFVVDLGSVSYVDSSGLGELVSIYTRIHALGGTVRFDDVDEKAARLMALTGVSKFFDVRPPVQMPDPLHPNLRNIGWELQIGLGVSILILIAVIVFR